MIEIRGFFWYNIEGNYTLNLHKILRIYIILLGIFLLASGIGLIVILNSLDPWENRTNIFLFYLDLFFLIGSASTLLSFYLRRFFGRRELLNAHFRVSLREGAMLGLLGVTVLVLQSFRILTPINAGSIGLALVFLESFFLVHDKQS